MAYVSFLDIDNQPITLDTMSIYDNVIPWINKEKIDVQIGTFNFPEQEIWPDITWRNTEIERTATDYHTITWTAWDINLSDWTTYTVNSWSKVISWITYFYYDWTNTVANTTTASDSVWPWKILLCVADVSTSPKNAILTAFWTITDKLITADNIASHTIVADNIASNTITGNEIASNTITANKLSVSTLSAITADLWNITAWTITWAVYKSASSWKRLEISSSWYSNKIAFFNASWRVGSIQAYDSERSIVIDWYYWFRVSVPNTITITWTGVNITAVWWWVIALTGNVVATDISSWSGNSLDIYWDTNVYLESWNNLNIVADWTLYLTWSTISSQSIIPQSSWSYNLWNSSYRRDTLYLSDWFNFSNTVVSALPTANRYILTKINWTTYKLLLST